MPPGPTGPRPQALCYFPGHNSLFLFQSMHVAQSSGQLLAFRRAARAG